MEVDLFVECIDQGDVSEACAQTIAALDGVISAVCDAEQHMLHVKVVDDAVIARRVASVIAKMHPRSPVRWGIKGTQ
jgi:phage-related protein